MNAVSPTLISSLSDSVFVLILSVHSFIYSSPFPPPHWLTLSLPVITSFSFSLPLGSLPTHSICLTLLHTFAIMMKNIREMKNRKKRGKNMNKKECVWGGECACRVHSPRRVLSISLSPHNILQIFEGVRGIQAPKIYSLLLGCSTWQWLHERHHQSSFSEISVPGNHHSVQKDPKVQC